MGNCYLVRRGGAGKRLPVLSAAYPADVTMWGEGGNAVFKVEIEKEGRPSVYTYQWFRNGTPVSGAAGAVCTFTNLTKAGTDSVYCVVTNGAGSVVSRIAALTVKSPVMTYTYTGEHEEIDDGNGNWRLKLKSSGLLTITEFGKNWDGCLDIFVVGGGGAGATGTGAQATYPNDAGGGGGGGGYTLTEHAVYMVRGKAYKVTIGNGGAAAAKTGGNGGSTSFDNLAKASGGNGGTKSGGNGGCGGGGSAYTSASSNPRQGIGGNGGSDGGNGTAGSNGTLGTDGAGGTGQGTTTREFGESTGDLYSGGGAGSGYNRYELSGNGGDGGGGDSSYSTWTGNAGNTPAAKTATDGEANTGGGGAGGLWTSLPASNGGSGIAVVRNTRSNPISITQQPQDVTAAESANAVFTVTATGTGLSYQWQFLPTGSGTEWSDTSATGAKTNQLTVQALSYRNNYQYRCVMTNGDGVKTTSLPATLTVQS